VYASIWRKAGRWRLTSADRGIAASLRAMVDLARSEPGIHVSPDDLDRDPWRLNVLNGTLDLRTGELEPQDPDDLITKLAPVEYDPEAKCVTWLGFLDRIMDGNQDLIDFLQRAAGYSLTGETTERVLFVLHGVGRNGKTTLLESLQAVLGEYAKVMAAEMLMARKNDGGIPNDVAALKGARLVTASEAEEGTRLGEAKVKQLTGGDTITARFLYGEFFSFRSEFKIWLATNHKPDVRGTDKAIWDRLPVVPFSVRIPDEEVDARLPQKLLDAVAWHPRVGGSGMPGLAAWRAPCAGGGPTGDEWIPTGDGRAGGISRRMLHTRSV
jgi:putative DNA primase/helicase